MPDRRVRILFQFEADQTGAQNLQNALAKVEQRFQKLAQQGDQSAAEFLKEWSAASAEASRKILELENTLTGLSGKARTRISFGEALGLDAIQIALNRAVQASQRVSPTLTQPVVQASKASDQAAESVQRLARELVEFNRAADAMSNQLAQLARQFEGLNFVRLVQRSLLLPKGSGMMVFQPGYTDMRYSPDVLSKGYRLPSETSARSGQVGQLLLSAGRIQQESAQVQEQAAQAEEQAAQVETRAAEQLIGAATALENLVKQNQAVVARQRVADLEGILQRFGTAKNIARQEFIRAEIDYSEGNLTLPEVAGAENRYGVAQSKFARIEAELIRARAAVAQLEQQTAGVQGEASREQVQAAQGQAQSAQEQAQSAREQARAAQEQARAAQEQQQAAQRRFVGPSEAGSPMFSEGQIATPKQKMQIGYALTSAANQMGISLGEAIDEWIRRIPAGSLGQNTNLEEAVQMFLTGTESQQQAAINQVEASAAQRQAAREQEQAARQQEEAARQAEEAARREEEARQAAERAAYQASQPSGLGGSPASTAWATMSDLEKLQVGYSAQLAAQQFGVPIDQIAQTWSGMASLGGLSSQEILQAVGMFNQASVQQQAAAAQQVQAALGQRAAANQQQQAATGGTAPGGAGSGGTAALPGTQYYTPGGPGSGGRGPGGGGGQAPGQGAGVVRPPAADFNLQRMWQMGIAGFTLSMTGTAMQKYSEVFRTMAQNYVDFVGKSTKSSGQWLSSQKRIEQASLRMGRTFTDALAPTIENLADLFENLAGVFERNPKLVSGLTGLATFATVVGGLFIGIGQTMSAAATFLNIVMLLREVLVPTLERATGLIITGSVAAKRAEAEAIRAIRGGASPTGSAGPAIASMRTGIATLFGPAIIPSAAIIGVIVTAVLTAFAADIYILPFISKVLKGLPDISKISGIKGPGSYEYQKGMGTMSLARFLGGVMDKITGEALNASGMSTKTEAMVLAVGKLTHSLSEQELATGRASIAAQKAAEVQRTLSTRILPESAIQSFADYEKELQQTEEQYGEDRVEIVQKYLEQITELEQEHADAVKRITEEYKNSVAEATSSYLKESANARADYSRAEQKAEEDFQLSESRALEDYLRNRADAQANYQEESIKAEKEYRDKLLELQRDHEDRVNDLLAKRDAIGLVEEERRYQHELEDAKKTYDDQEAERKKQLAQNLADMAENYALERARRLEDYQRQQQERLEDYQRQQAERQADYQQKLADLQAQKEKELAEENDKYAKSLAQLQEAKQKELDALKNAYDEQLKKINESFIERIRQIDATLLADYNQWVATMTATGERFRTWLETYADDINLGTSSLSSGTAGTATTSSNVGQRASGGYAGFGTYQLGEKGREFVLSADTTRRAEELLGGKLSQDNLLQSMVGGQNLNIALNFPAGSLRSEIKSIVKQSKEAVLQELDSILAMV